MRKALPIACTDISFFIIFIVTYLFMQTVVLSIAHNKLLLLLFEILLKETSSIFIVKM